MTAIFRLKSGRQAVHLPIRRRLSGIRKFLYVKSPKGFYRTFWAKAHPDVINASKLWYRNQQISKEDISRPVDSAKNGFGLGQNCPTTNNTTIKETINNTTATPVPLPAGGQAPALLTDREAQQKAEAQSQIKQLKRWFGKPKTEYKPLPPEEFEQSRQRKLKQLLAGEQKISDS